MEVLAGHRSMKIKGFNSQFECPRVIPNRRPYLLETTSSPPEKTLQVPQTPWILGRCQFWTSRISGHHGIQWSISIHMYSLNIEEHQHCYALISWKWTRIRIHRPPPSFGHTCATCIFSRQTHMQEDFLLDFGRNEVEFSRGTAEPFKLQYHW